MRKDSLASIIAGVGAYIPERKVTNADVLRYLREGSEGYLEEQDLATLMSKAESRLAKAGCGLRHWCHHDEYCTDIARIASERAMTEISSPLPLHGLRAH